MKKILSILLASTFLSFCASQSQAGNSTANATAGTGDYVYFTKTDGSGHFGGVFSLCDGVALASCATVTGGLLSITGNIGTVTTVTAVTAITNALPAGSNVIGHVIMDTTSTTAVTQATASNLNATVVGTGTFAVQAAQSGTWNITNISGTISLPTGASTSAKQPALGTAGSASTDVLTVQGIASMTPLLVTLSGTNNINNISGTITLPTLAATSTKQSDGTQKSQIVDGSGNVIASTSNNLNVQCANCSGSGASAADAATFTAGTSVFAPAGGQFTAGGATACVTAHQCMVGMTAARAFFTDISSVNAVTVLTGTGAVGTGAQRIAVGTDTATIAGSAPGTAGSASTNVLTVQGIASMTPILANPGTAANWGVVTQGSTTSGQSGTLTQCAVTTAAPSYTTAQTSPLSCDTAGNLRVLGTGIAQGSTTSGQSGSLVMGAVTTAAPSYTTAQSSPLSLDTAGNLRVVSGTAFAVQNTTAVNVTTTDCSVSITTGGTAQNAFTGQTGVHGFTIANIDSTTGSGEPVWFSWTTTAAASTTQSYPLPAPTASTFASYGSFTSPPGMGVTAVSVIAATTGHKISCTRW